MGLVESIVSAAAGPVLEFGSTMLQDRLNTRARHGAQDFEEQMFKHRYQYQVADMEAAGLNPMLSYTQSPGSAPSSSAQAATKPDFVKSMVEMRANTAQVANVNADTVKKIAEARNVDTNTMVQTGMVEQVAAMTSAALASAEQSKMLAEQIRVSIPKIEAEILRIKTEIEKDKSNIRLNDSLILANKYLNSLRMAETTLHNQSATLRGPRVDAYSDKSKLGYKLKSGSDIGGDVMQNFYRMINPFYNLLGGPGGTPNPIGF